VWGRRTNDRAYDNTGLPVIVVIEVVVVIINNNARLCTGHKLE
jgi:hypothetical protein